MRSIDPFVGVLALAVTLAGVALHAGLGPRDTYWTIDNGGKALVLQQLRAHPGSGALDYPGAAVDPEMRWFPQPLTGNERYAVVRDGGIVSQYASPFVWAAWPFRAWLGFFGLGVLPALGGGLTILATGLLAARTGARPRVAAILVALGTPLLFYSSVFWEHSLTIAFAGFAFASLAGDRPEPGRAGLWIGLALFLREELVLLAIALLVALGVRRVPWSSWLRAGAGVALGVAATLAFQRATTGAWGGVRVAVNAPVPFVHSAEAAQGLVFGTGFSGVGSTLSVALAASILLAPLTGRFARPLAAAAGVGLAAIALLAFVRFPGGQDGALALIRSNSALVFVPWAFLSVPSLRERDSRLAWIAWTFLVLFVLVVPERSITGIHPGPRMLLPLLPIFAVEASRRARESRASVLAFALLFVVAVGWNARSLQLLAGKRHLVGRVASALASDSRRVVATDLFWLPTELSALWSEKQFHLVTTPGDLAALCRAVGATGKREILVVVREGSIEREPLARVSDARFPEFSVDVHVQGVGGAQP